MPDTTIKLHSVVLDCPDPTALAAFYAKVIGGTVADGSDDTWAYLDAPHSLLQFQRVDNYTRPDWPDGTPQQFHLDLEVEDIVATHELVVAAGAAPLDPVDPPHPSFTRNFRVYADPVGHPFCLCGGTSVLTG